MKSIQCFYHGAKRDVYMLRKKREGRERIRELESDRLREKENERVSEK